MRKKKVQMVACDNEGCTTLLTSREFKEHMQICIYQMTSCQGCGEKMKAKDLLVHQKVKQCLEKTIKRERIQFAKSMHKKVVAHNQRIKTLTIGVDQSRRQRVKDMVHDKIGWSPCVPNAWGEDFERSMNSSPKSHRTGSRSKHHSTPRSIMNTNNELNSEFGQDGDNKEFTKSSSLRDAGSTTGSSSKGVRFKEELVSPHLDVVDYQGPNQSVEETNWMITADVDNQLMEINNHDEISTIGCSSTDTGHNSVQSNAQPPALCMRCGKFFRLRSNHQRACRFHRGPMINLHGMCTACGMLDFQTGCCEGLHMPIQI